MVAQPNLLRIPKAPGAITLTRSTLTFADILSVINGGPESAQTTLQEFLTFLAGNITVVPIINGIVSIDISVGGWGIYKTTINANFRMQVVNTIAGAANSFVWWGIGNGTTYTSDFTFAHFSAGSFPIPTSTNGKRDTLTFLEDTDASWFGYDSGTNA